ncbi:hypothetical protein [Roseivirga pacifica]|uniref:hypothetical protein n=1 Tax=Roseivirga pacifica TaxID=1267423 RepID=UPI003BAB990D
MCLYAVRTRLRRQAQLPDVNHTGNMDHEGTKSPISDAYSYSELLIVLKEWKRKK